VVAGAADGLGWVVGALLLLLSLQRLRDLAGVRPLPATSPERHEGRAAPRVSLIITARDEESRIETSVRRAIAQRQVELELIVVDDRSTDDTPGILGRLAVEHPRLTVLRVDRLPENWLGKPHACHVGAQRATGDWLLFTDADSWMADGVVARAVAAAETHRAHHVCLFPGEPNASVAARATLLNFSAGLVHYASKANRDDPDSMIGVGAFNLVRAEAYRSIGGHRALRLEVVDDLKLGLLLRRAGFRSRAFGAAADVEVHWAPTVGQLIRALEKNMFAMLDFSALRGVTAVVGLALIVLASLAAPALGGSGGIAAIVGWASTLIPSAIMARHSRWGLAAALLTPVTTPVMVVAVGNSVYRTLRQGGIRWRGTFYPLERLRRGLVRH
jgi:hypothetical protein